MLLFNFRAILVFFIVALNVEGVSALTVLEKGKSEFEEEKYEDALASFSEGMKAGDSQSIYYLARMMDLGLGVDVDKSAAKELYLRAAEQGHAPSLNRMALMSYKGEEGVTQDYQKAKEYFEKAAEQDDRNALFNLGKLYFEGKGVDQNGVKAMEYYKKAADKDHILALNTLGSVYKLGSITEKDRVLSRKYFARSAKFGNAVGLFETALNILSDKPSSETQIKAHMYLNLASTRLHPNASEALQLLSDQMQVEDVIAAQNMAKSFNPLSSQN